MGYVVKYKKHTESNLNIMVTMYTTETCSICRVLKKSLTRHGITFEEVDITNDEAKREDLLQRGIMAVPYVESPTVSFQGFRPDLIAKLA